MPYAKYTKNMPVSCDKCSHTTQNVGWMKLHTKNQAWNEPGRWKTALAEIIHEEKNIQKYYTFESTCNYIRLILIF